MVIMREVEGFFDEEQRGRGDALPNLATCVSMGGFEFAFLIESGNLRARIRIRASWSCKGAERCSRP